MNNNLPTTPGPYWWREKDGDEWDRVLNVQLSDSMGLCVDLGFYYETVKERGGQWAKAHSPEELATLRAKADAYDKAMSIPLRDGSRLKVGECFVEEDSYPFFSAGYENYNAELYWCDESKSLLYDIYRVSDRVSGNTCGGIIDDLNLDRIVQRPCRNVRVCEVVV